MLNKNKFVVQSLELHLFFARIMKEHALFLEAGFTPQNADLMREANTYKQEFEKILLSAVELSNGVISDSAVKSGEFITDFTLGAEQKTQKFTGIFIDTNITIKESRLYGSRFANITDEMVMKVTQINRNALKAVGKLIVFKHRILSGMLSCEIFTVNYPLLIEHIIREAHVYQGALKDLENGIDLDIQNKKETELFWNQIMMEHALFIRGLLDPTENALIIMANDFAGDYSHLIQAAKAATDATMAAITADTLATTKKYQEFKTAGTKGIAECKIQSIILPLLADHVLREANHYIRLLQDSDASAPTLKTYTF